MHFTIWTERIKDKGEDAPPTLLFKQNRGLLAVYDGLGGAGSASYTLPPEQLNQEPTTATGAYIASRLAKQLTEQVFQNAEFIDDNFIETLKYKLRQAFRLHIAEIDRNPSKLRSKLIKRLPTTIAGFWYEKKENFLVEVHAFWAGDSRCYLLTSTGLVQISKDDLKNNPDALSNLLDDGVISNCINADTDFILHQFDCTLDEPFMLITATDGCFAYLETPAHFEYVLLNTLMKAHSIEEWKELLTQQFVQVAGDDVSMSFLGLNFGEHINEIKAKLIMRFQELESTYIKPIENFDLQIKTLKKQEKIIRKQIQELEQRKSALRGMLWEEYKKNYYWD
ncbi:MAG: hypothetical protein NZ551_06685 [Microscillaceae bacterium]|nr:hypothetical protein [Microscillaceae bacterium]MDW8460880.1 hypothetical protein [Cytophagales bacterium]